MRIVGVPVAVHVGEEVCYHAECHEDEGVPVFFGGGGGGRASRAGRCWSGGQSRQRVQCLPSQHTEAAAEQAQGWCSSTHAALARPPAQPGTHSPHNHVAEGIQHLNPADPRQGACKCEEGRGACECCMGINELRHPTKRAPTSRVTLLKPVARSTARAAEASREGTLQPWPLRMHAGGCLALRASSTPTSLTHVPPTPPPGLRPPTRTGCWSPRAGLHTGP